MKYIYLLVLVGALITKGNFKCKAQTVNLTPVITGITSPLGVENCGDSRLFVVSQTGKILVADSNYNVATLPFLNIANRVTSGGETGLLGLAFHPDYKHNGYFYVNYIRTVGNQLQSVVARYNVSANNPNRADSLSEQILFTVAQPYSNHNGGCVKFGPDGYLYLGFGDGGSGYDPQHNGQNTNIMLAKILRIDVNNGNPYAIPADNPFAGMPNHVQEIWSYGMRNPWRITFDRLNGDLWIADVGQSLWEEIDYQKAGAPGGRNYGWVCYEADAFTNQQSNCPPVSTITFPVYAYPHASGGDCSITGGYVYRGTKNGDLFGKYIFSDLCSGKMRTFNLKDSSVQLIHTGAQPSSFGEDAKGELYLCDYSNGTVVRLDQVHCYPVAYIQSPDSVTTCGVNNITLSALKGAGFSYKWFRNSDSIAGAHNPDFTVSDTGNYQLVVTNISGCSAQSQTVAVVNDRPPVISINNIPDVCASDDPFSLSANPSGGIFSGNAVVNNSFIPGSATPGTQTVQYIFTDRYGCVLNDSTSFKVLPLPQITFNLPDTVCGNANYSLKLNATPAGGIFNGDSIVSNNTAILPNAGATYVISYTVSDSNGCVNSLSKSVYFDICSDIEAEPKAYFKIYPNPTKDDITISFYGGGRMERAIVTDVLGNTVSETDISKNNNGASIIHLPATQGLYFIYVRGMKEEYVTKVIKE